jgi:small subunit ribosomal protein S16
MLMIRLQRVGRVHEPVFRLVLTDSKNGPKSGKFLKILGNMDMRRSEKAEFKIDRVKHWVANGAKLSDTVHNLLVERKLIEGKKINVLPKKTPVVSEEAKAAAEEAKKAEATPSSAEPKEEVATEAPVEEVVPEAEEEEVTA